MPRIIITWLLVITYLIAGDWLARQASVDLPLAARDVIAMGPAVVPARLGAIGDLVWYDADGDGIEDVGEPGIANVQLALYLDNDGSGTVTPGDSTVMTTTTDADGGYLFDSVADGTYLVGVLNATDPAGPLFGLTQVVGNQSQPQPTAPINVSGGDIYRDADFGYRLLTEGHGAVIGDRVWYDGNADQMQQGGEPGIAGVQVCATPAGGGAQTCATTNAAGRYLLDLPGGSYSIAPTSGIPIGLSPSTPASKNVVAAAGQQLLVADFGYKDPAGSRLGAIGDLVFADTNADGRFDAAESALAGVSVDLIRDTNGNRAWDLGEPVIATAISGSALDANGGNYRFTGAPAGAYLVHISAAGASLVDYTRSPLGGADTNNRSQADPYPVNLVAGVTVLTADFGFYLTGFPDSGVIGNLLWAETDGNGVFNPASGDIGQAGVTIELSQGEEVVAATTTGPGGQYSFPRLAAGAYSLRVSDDFGILENLTPSQLGPAPGQDNNNQAQPYTMTLVVDQYLVTADLGYYRVSRLGAIGDFIWYDMDGDGIEDLDEPGLPNIRVVAYLDTNSNGILDAGDTLSAETVTDALGGYLLTGFAPGTYFVDVMDAANPNGPINGLAHSVGMQSQPDPTAPINLASGQIYKDADFGYVRLPQPGKAVVGDLVWYDGDGDGLRRPGEPGVPGVTVAITDGNGLRIASGVTDAAGVYWIEAPAGSGYVAGPDLAVSPILAGLRATSAAPAFLPPLAAGQQWLAARFGFGEGAAQASLLRVQGVQGPLLGTIGNLVFLDADWNGVYGASDAALGGVTVALIRDSNSDGAWQTGEPIIATAITSSTVDITGANYGFTGAPAGSYLVHVNDTAGLLSDYSRSPLGLAGADGNNQADPYAVVLAAGASNRTADFGFYRASAMMAGVIGNLVWGETDGDGAFAPAQGDLGVAGVTVALYREGSEVAATTTAADGSYAFIGQDGGVYQVAVRDDFGVLAGYSPTTAGAPGQDNQNQTQPYTLTLPNNSADLTADFGYRTGLGSGQNGATYTITVQGGADLRPGVVVSFTIRITNTGAAWITYLPAQLVYSPTYLTYLGAIPASTNNMDDGLIQWSDLVGSFSALAPGAGMQVVAGFRTLADTSLLPGGRTTAVAAVRGAWANPSGPTLLGTSILLPEQSAAGGVRIIIPTGLLVTGLAATRSAEGVTVAWQTANEARILGFEVLRRAPAASGAGPWRVISEPLIVAESSGANQGNSYAYLDRSATPTGRYEYQVAVWLLDGSKVIVGPVAPKR